MIRRLRTTIAVDPKMMRRSVEDRTPACAGDDSLFIGEITEVGHATICDVSTGVVVSLKTGGPSWHDA